MCSWFGWRRYVMGTGAMMRWCFCLAAALFVVQTPRVLAADTEIRDFNITIDGNESGRYRMTIDRRDNGTISMAGQAAVKVKKLGITVYQYTYSGTEVWKDGKEGRLLGMNSTSDDNGTKFEVNVAPEADLLRVRVNGRPRLVRADVWTTTYWKLAHSRFHNQNVPLLDADTGKDFSGKLDYLGVAQLTVAGQNQTCHHFRITGGPNPVDLWYDSQHRLVRQEFSEDGHRTILQLVSIRR
jgi:hypothetical protein